MIPSRCVLPLRRRRLVLDTGQFQKQYEQSPAKKKLFLIKAAVKHEASELVAFFRELGTKEHDEIIKATLARAIGVLGGPGEIPTVSAFLDDPDPRVRANAIEGLRAIGHPTVYPIIAKYLSSTDNRIKANAVKAMRDVGKQNMARILEGMLASPDTGMRDSAAHCLTMFSSESFLPLLRKGMRDPDRDVRRKIRTAIERLAGKGNEQARALLFAFSDETQVVRVDHIESFDSLLQTPSRSVTAKTGIHSMNERIRRVAVQGLIGRGDQESVETLCNRLLFETDADVRVAIVAGLADLQSEGAKNDLVRCIEDEDARVRLQALRGLTTLAPGLLPDYSEELLGDNDPQVRALAILALKDVLPLDVLESLGEMVYDSSLEHRRQAVEVIRALSDERVVYFIDPLLQDSDDTVLAEIKAFVLELDDSAKDLAANIRNELSEQALEVLESA